MRFMISTVAVTMSCNGKGEEYANAFPDAFSPDFWSCRDWHQGLRPANAHLGFNQEACRKRWPGTSTESFQVCSLVRVTGRPRNQNTQKIANWLALSFFSIVKLTSNSLRHRQESQGGYVVYWRLMRLSPVSKARNTSLLCQGMCTTWWDPLLLGFYLRSVIDMYFAHPFTKEAYRMQYNGGGRKISKAVIKTVGKFRR